MLKIVIVGYGQMFTSLIQGSFDCKADVVGVFRYENVKIPPFLLFFKNIFAPSRDYIFIKNRKLYDIKARSVNSTKFKNEILRLNPDIILVGSWGEKFQKDVINLPKIATINTHPSLLPKYRGANPYSRAIMAGETKSGVTFHLMDENFDTGAILAQEEVNILPYDTGASLKTKITAVARKAVCELLIKLSRDIIIPLKQNESRASYAPQIKEEDVYVNPEKTSVEIYNQIRGLFGFTSCIYKNNYVNGCEIVNRPPKGKMEFAAKDGKTVSLNNFGTFKLNG